MDNHLHIPPRHMALIGGLGVLSWVGAIAAAKALGSMLAV